MENFYGVIIGAISFILIGLFHPVVVKCEYHFSARVWPLFLVAGLALCLASLLAEHVLLSASLAVAGFSALWSIGELKEQEERVRKGWFPRNPRRDHTDV